MKAITKLIGILIKTVLALLLIALLLPVLYFAWRANQPMEMPEFKGLTYIQYMDWRKMILNESEQRYRQAHPDVQFNSGGCYNAELLLQATGTLTILPYIIKMQPEAGDWLDFTWAGLEGTALIVTDRSGYTRPWCDTQSVIPTPEQYQAMKQERALANP
jgi:hypothetical protein